MPLITTLQQTTLPDSRPAPFPGQMRTLIYRYWHRTVLHRHGTGHVFLAEQALVRRCRIHLAGRENRLEISPGAQLWNVTISLHGERLHCRIGPDCRLRGGALLLEDTGSRLEIGAKTSALQSVLVASEGGLVRLGEDCLLGYGTDLRNGDGRSIIDGETKMRLNPADDVELGDHVWLGMHSQVLKGVKIGDGAVVAPRTLVNLPVASRSYVGGVPAQILRENIHWEHRR
jgi:acetyltransferase-like isoleucine patch superfamily enzyme